MPKITSWTSEEVAAVMHKRDVERKKWEVIAGEMGRSRSACQSKWDATKNSRTRIAHAERIERVRQDRIEERNYRVSLAPRDLSAAFFGDPPVGYSALDKRKQFA